MQRALLILLFAASYLLFAGGEPWTLVGLLSLAAVAASSAPRATFAFRRHTRPLDLALITLLAAIAIQIIPLPAGIVTVLSPHAIEIATAVRLTPLGAGGSSWRTLSVNPDATLISLGTVALGAISFWIARAVFSAGGGTRLFCRALALFGVLAAGMAVIQKAVAPRSVLFLVEPAARSASPFGAFVNRNHFAAWLLMMAAPVVGYSVARIHIYPARRGRWPQSIGRIMSSGAIFSATAAIGMIGVVLLTLSRSALAGLGCAAIAFWWFGKPRLPAEQTGVPWMLGLAGAAVLMVVLFVDVDGWATRLGQTFDTSGGFSRVTIWRESIPIIRDFWPAGTGAGTYSDAMKVYQKTRIWVGSMQRWAHFNNAHSFYIQVASEGGVLLGIPALWAGLAAAMLGWRSVRADRGEMFWVRVGAFAGLTGVAVQSVWEVALVMPANAALAGMLTGLMLYQREVTGTRSAQMTPMPPTLTPTARVRMAR
ncbi:MAG: O-antigen ligase family protein [Vicinamibacterales bacterium]